MPANPPSALEQQIARVRRRLFLQTLIDAATWSCTVAFALSFVWFFVEPARLHQAYPWLRWSGVAGAFALAALVSLAIAWLRSPSPLAAALALDDRFNLKQRATTSLGLNPREAESAAGKALVEDVNRRMAALPIAERFPVRAPWAALAVPVALIGLVVLSFFYRPIAPVIQANDLNLPVTTDPVRKQGIEQAKKELADPKNEKDPGPRVRDPKIQKLIEEGAELAHQPTDTKDEANQFIKDAAKAEEANAEARQKIDDRNDAIRDRFNQEQRLNPERLAKKKNGPAQGLQDAMKDGDLKRAADELHNLSKLLDPEQQKRVSEKLDKLKDKIGDAGLTPEEKERIQKEFDKLNEEKLTEEQKKDLQEALNDLEKALDELAEPEKREKELAKQLDELREKLAQEAKERENELKKAEEQMAAAEKKLDRLLNDEQKKLREQMKDLEAQKKELEQKDADPKKKEEELKKLEERKKELERKDQEQAKDAAEQKKAADELRKAREQAEEQRRQNQAEGQQAARQQEKLRRELEEMKKNNEQIDRQTREEMKELANKLAECDRAMKEGRDGDAAKKLQEARDQMRRMSGDGDRQRLLDQIARLQKAREAVCRAMNGEGNGNGQGDNANGRGVASGKRPLGQDEETRHIDANDAPEMSKGALRITDFLNGPGGDRGARGPAQMTDEMRIRAAQEGASALSRQRIDRPSDTDRVRGYFDNMRGPEKGKK